MATGVVGLELNLEVRPSLMRLILSLKEPMAPMLLLLLLLGLPLELEGLPLDAAGLELLLD